MSRPDRPEVKTAIPVYIPNNEDEPYMGTELDEDGFYRGSVAKATLKAGTLVLEFKDTFPAIAIQRLLSRGALMGLQFILNLEEAPEGSSEETPSKTPAELAADKIEAEGN